MNLPKRKHPRLKKYDYSQTGCYFITICIKNRLHLLGEIPDNVSALPNVWEENPSLIILSDIGRTVQTYITSINETYPAVSVDHSVIMPNHIHLLISIIEHENNDVEMLSPRPTLNTILRSFKTMITKQIGYSIWQESFYDRIIRDDKGYLEVFNYIDKNQLKWHEDELYGK